MNEQEIRDNIKLGLKSTSSDFTDKIMFEISSLQNEVQIKSKRIFRLLLFACCLLFFLSIFISIPDIQFFNYSIGFSKVIMPIISLICIFIVVQYIYDVRTWIINERQNNEIQHFG